MNTSNDEEYFEKVAALSHENVFPQIKEKSIVDFVNGLDVIDDHLRVKVASNGAAHARLWGVITGTNARRQLLIDENILDGMRFIQSYISNNEKGKAKNDLLIKKTANGVALLSNKVREIYGTQEVLKEDINQIRFCLNEAEKIILDIDVRFEKRFEMNELKSYAETEMNYVVSEWEDGSHGFSPEQGLWMVCTRLRWGKFGAWLSACQSNAEDKSRRSQSEQMISILEHKCRKVLNEKTGRSDNKLIRREDLLKAVTSREDAHRDVLCLLSAQQIRPLEKIIYMQNAHAENNDLAVLPTELPYVFSNIGIVKEMISLLSRAD